MVKQSDLLPEKGCCKSGCPRVSQGPSTWQVGHFQGNDDDVATIVIITTVIDGVIIQD